MRHRAIVPLLVGLALVACSIKQNVKPVTPADLATKEICIRENKTVREGFLEAYRQALESKGFSVRMLDADAGIRACPLLTTYTANWRWDLALYMAYQSVVKVDEKSLASNEATNVECGPWRWANGRAIKPRCGWRAPTCRSRRAIRSTPG
jgi:hypothetical protein